jgi:hypothetical protein
MRLREMAKMPAKMKKREYVLNSRADCIRLYVIRVTGESSDICMEVTVSRGIRPANSGLLARALFKSIPTSETVRRTL